MDMKSVFVGFLQMNHNILTNVWIQSNDSLGNGSGDIRHELKKRVKITQFR